VTRFSIKGEVGSDYFVFVTAPRRIPTSGELAMPIKVALVDRRPRLFT
jgi:hypothetical protein